MTPDFSLSTRAKDPEDMPVNFAPHFVQKVLLDEIAVPHCEQKWEVAMVITPR